MIEFIVGLLAGGFSIWLSFITNGSSSLSQERITLYKQINMLATRMLLSPHNQEEYGDAQRELIFLYSGNIIFLPESIYKFLHQYTSHIHPEYASGKTDMENIYTSLINAIRGHECRLVIDY